MATQIAKEKSAYRDAFQERQDADGAAWIKRLREGAIERFEQLGFPTTDDEEWKYTNVAPIAKINFAPAGATGAQTRNLSAAQLKSFAYEEASRSQLVFVNGIYNRELSTVEALPEGVVVADLSSALADARLEQILRGQLARGADYNTNGFTALNTAFLKSGAFILIPRGVEVNVPLHLLFLANAQAEAPVAAFPRVLIVCERDSSATVIESYASAEDEARYLTNAVVEIVLEENARLEHYKVQRESAKAFHIATTTAALGRSSHLNSTTITLGAQLSRHDIKVTLDNEGAECSIDGLYLVGDGQHADTHSLIDHRQPHCASRQLYKGILDGKSRAVFNGKVFVREGAQQTDAQQTNRNLLLSNEARVDTKPQLEIFADDVKCAHGATVGQLEDEELFYLASRGLHTDIARNLLTYGFAEEVIGKIKIESIKAQLDEAVLNRLHARLEA
ncbi:MAG: Fe-S cluster assembly protein SufD [Blastocatellia bacterium]|jgi:Fe-S cluster assembly protein SufD|nr:Fe-S cluster assembly protein SufD [Blastocatellia bacterium]